jgi:hypothetical protein
MDWNSALLPLAMIVVPALLGSLLDRSRALQHSPFTLSPIPQERPSHDGRLAGEGF